MQHLQTFKLDDTEMAVQFVERMAVKEGVVCDVYTFTDDSSKDLGIVTVTANHKTPLQLVLKGTSTIEGYPSGSGQLTVVDDNGTRTYSFPSDQIDEVEVKVSQIVQWQAGPEGLVFFEICTPPYEDGRFQDLD